MPISRAATAPPARSVGASGGRSTSTGRRVAMSRKARSSSAWRQSELASGPSRSACSRRGLERAVAAQDVRGALLADALGAGQAVGGIAAQRDEVGHLLGLDAVALAHLRRPDLLRPLLAAAAEQQHASPRGRALEQVAVAGQDQRHAAGVLLVRGARAQQVVGLEVVGVGDVPAERAVESRAPLPLVGEVVGDRRAVGVVAG